MTEKRIILIRNEPDNLRYSFNACIFGATNTTDPVTTPCSLDTACGPIQGAMLEGMSNPATLQQYSYCSAYDNSFVGAFLGTCGTCLTETTNAVIFSNCTVFSSILKALLTESFSSPHSSPCWLSSTTQTRRFNWSE